MCGGIKSRFFAHCIMLWNRSTVFNFYKLFDTEVKYFLVDNGRKVLFVFFLPLPSNPNHFHGNEMSNIQINSVNGLVISLVLQWPQY